MGDNWQRLCELANGTGRAFRAADRQVVSWAASEIRRLRGQIAAETPRTMVVCEKAGATKL